MASAVVATSFQRMRPQRSHVRKSAANTCRSNQAQGFSTARAVFGRGSSRESAYAGCAREQLELRGGAGRWVVLVFRG